MRLGLFGGTFNPIHIGHLRAAVEVAEAFSLDRLLLIPSARPPHKNTDDMASARDRLEMVRLAVQGMSPIEASDVELSRSGPSYTIETLRHFQDQVGPNSTIYFVVGLDAFSEITTWKSYKQLFSTAHFIVMTRPGSQVKSLEDFIHTHISTEYDYDRKSDLYDHPQCHPIICFRITHLDVSATQIRGSIRHNRSIRFLVPETVERFIKEKRLYR